MKLHQNQVPGHTSNVTAAFLEKMKLAKVYYIFSTYSYEVTWQLSPMDYCAFDLLKRALSKYKYTTINGLWKVMKDEWQWQTITLEIVCKAIHSIMKSMTQTSNLETML